MMKKLTLEKDKTKVEENIIKCIRNLFGLKKETDDNIDKDKKKFFRLRKENKAIKDKIIRDVKNLLMHEQEDSIQFN